MFDMFNNEKKPTEEEKVEISEWADREADETLEQEREEALYWEEGDTCDIEEVTDRDLDDDFSDYDYSEDSCSDWSNSDNF